MEVGKCGVAYVWLPCINFLLGSSFEKSWKKAKKCLDFTLIWRKVYNRNPQDELEKYYSALQVSSVARLQENKETWRSNQLAVVVRVNQASEATLVSVFNNYTSNRTNKIKSIRLSKKLPVSNNFQNEKFVKYLNIPHKLRANSSPHLVTFDLMLRIPRAYVPLAKNPWSNWSFNSSSCFLTLVNPTLKY